MIHKDDGVVTISGSRGIAISEPFKATSHFDYELVVVDFEEFQMPVQVASVVEVWRNGVQVTTEGTYALQLSLL